MKTQDKQYLHKMAEDKRKQEDREEVLVRIVSKDIPGSKNVYTGLTRIKGVSWSISNYICTKLKIDRLKKIRDLSQEELKNIEEELKNPKFYVFLRNRQRDFDTGKDEHLLGVDLDLKKEFDIKRLKKIKSYRGLRHSLGQPTRGQSTRSHFRTTGVAVGVKKSKTGKKS